MTSICSSAAANIVRGTRAKAASRTAPSPTASSISTPPTRRSWSAAASRSRMVRSLAFLPTLAASVNRVLTTMSNRSSTSSCALASSVRTKASNVAVRRSSGIRATACALATVAKRASAATRPGGTWSMVSRPRANPRTSSSLPTARDSSAPLRRYGPSRSRSSRLGRPPSPATSRASSCARCSDVMSRARVRQSRRAARARMRATKRSRADAPGRRTFPVTSQTVARSNSTLGRSVPVQHRA